MAKTAKKAKAKGGRGLAQSAIVGAPQVRSVFIDAAGKRWRWVVDNRMRDYGAMTTIDASSASTATSTSANANR